VRVKKRLLVSAILILLGRIAMSQQVVGPATFSPSAPTAQDTIRATYSIISAGCGTTSSTVVTGTFVRTTVFVSGCFIGPPPGSSPLQSSFGPLLIGTYTYEIDEVYEGGAPQLISTQPLVVTAAVPTLSLAVLASLAVILAVVAMLALRATN
jgi:hypothetical protein